MCIWSEYAIVSKASQVERKDSEHWRGKRAAGRTNRDRRKKNVSVYIVSLVSYIVCIVLVWLHLICVRNLNAHAIYTHLHKVHSTYSHPKFATHVIAKSKQNIWKWKWVHTRTTSLFVVLSRARAHSSVCSLSFSPSHLIVSYLSFGTYAQSTINCEHTTRRIIPRETKY